MNGEVCLVAGSLAALVGVGVLRASWSRPKRSSSRNAVGWLLLVAGSVCAWVAAGAWGVAVASLFPMGGAMALLAVAAVGSAPSKLRASNRRVGLVPDRGEPLRLGGRALTFVLVAVLAAWIGLGIAAALGWLALLAGAAKADAYAVAMFASPIAWSALAFALLMQPRRSGQVKVLAVASIPIWPCLATAFLA